jgi:hypothetical protein
MGIRFPRVPGEFGATKKSGEGDTKCSVEVKAVESRHVEMRQNRQQNFFSDFFARTRGGNANLALGTTEDVFNSFIGKEGNVQPSLDVIVSDAREVRLRSGGGRGQDEVSQPFREGTEGCWERTESTEDGELIVIVDAGLVL